jgi:hypothetical protein
LIDAVRGFLAELSRPFGTARKCADGTWIIRAA